MDTPSGNRLQTAAIENAFAISLMIWIIAVTSLLAEVAMRV